MTEKKYSEDDVKRIVSEALRQQREDDQRLIDEVRNNRGQDTVQEQTFENDVNGTAEVFRDLPDHLRKNKSEDNGQSSHWQTGNTVKYKEQNLSEMRTGCGIILLSSIIGGVLLILLLLGMAG